MLKRWTWLILFGFFGLLAVGCGTTCKQISENHDRFWERPHATAGTHLVAAIPFVSTSKWLTDSVQSLGDKPLTLTLPKGVAAIPGGLALKLLRIEALPAEAGKLGLALVLGVVDAQATTIVESRTALELSPTVDATKGTMTWKLRGEDIESLTFRVTDAGLERLSDFVFEKLPKNTRRLAPKELIRGAVQTALSEFEQPRSAWAKNHPFDRLGTLLSVEWSFSQLPLSGLRLRSSPSHLIAEIQLALPIAESLVPQDLGSLNESAVRLWVGGHTVAEIANLLITKNRVPGRFDRNGAPQRDGVMRAALGFHPGERPLKILTWCLEEPCIQAKIGAKIDVGLTGGKISATASDPALEELQGPALAELGAYLGAVGVPAVERSVQRAATFVILVGGKPIKWSTTSLQTTADGYVLDLTPSWDHDEVH